MCPSAVLYNWLDEFETWYICLYIGDRVGVLYRVMCGGMWADVF